MTGSRTSGFELLPHTADVMVSAWAPTAEGCLTQAVRGLVACFTDARQLRPERAVTFACEPAPVVELLVELLEEVIYLMDTHDVVPVQAAFARTPQGGLLGEFGVVPQSSVDLIGPVPKAVTRHGLRFDHDPDDDLWRCAVVVDV